MDRDVLKMKTDDAVNSGPPFVARVIEGERAIQAWDQLLRDCFPVPAGASFFDDFPVWRDLAADSCFRVGLQDEGGRWLASAACRLGELKVDAPTHTTVGLIGCVATGPSARGKGFASGLVRLCCDWAKNRGAAGAFLWSGEGEFYRRLGFEPCGAQVRVPLESFFGLSRGDAGQGLELRPGLSSSIEKMLLERRVGGMSLRRRDLPWIRAHKNVRWWGIYQRRDLLAYAAIGRGIDLTNCVHEWGGEQSALVTLFGRLAAQESGLVLLASPGLLKKHGFAANLGVLEPLVHAQLFDSSMGSASQVFAGVSDQSSGATRSKKELWFWGLDGC